MTVTEIQPKATTKAESPPDDTEPSPATRLRDLAIRLEKKWGQGDPQSCWRTITGYQNGQVFQQAIRCKQLDCEWCGPERRQEGYDIAIRQFSKERVIYAVRVPAYKVDHLRKWASRREAPIKSCPVSDDENVVFSPVELEGSHVATPEEIRRILIEERVSRRHLKGSGRWAGRKTDERRIETKMTTISRGNVSADAFRNVAKALNKKVLPLLRGQSFRDTENHGPAFYKQLLYAEEARLKRKRLQDRGVLPKGWSSQARLAA